MSTEPPAAEHPETSAAYSQLLDELSERIRSTQLQAGRVVNTLLVGLYWSIGRDILERQQREGWGTAVIDRLGADLRARFPQQKGGFSRRNLFYMRRFAALWTDPEQVQTLSAQIGWSHHQVLLDTFRDDRRLYEWYAHKAAEGGWSVRHLRGRSTSNCTYASAPRSPPSRRRSNRPRPPRRWRSPMTPTCSTSSTWPKTRRSAISSTR